MAYNTGNPIGSADPRDLYDNAQNLDELTNSQSKLSHPDRRGVSRKTWHGMEEEFDAAQADNQQRFNLLLANSGYEYLADYAAGIEVTEYNQVIRDTAGELWRASAVTELPYTTTGAGLPEGGAFVSVGDAALRQELAAENGALLARGAVIYVDTIADLQALPTSELVDGQSARISSTGRSGDFVWMAGNESSNVSSDQLFGIYIPPSDDLSGASGAWKRVIYDSYIKPEWFGAEGDGVVDDSAALQGAIDAFDAITSVVNTATAISAPTIYLSSKKYLISSQITIYQNKRWASIKGSRTILLGDGSSNCFYYDGTQRVSVEGIEFQNFVDCISFDTNNIAGATFTVRSCSCFDSETFIDSRGYTDSRSTVTIVENCFSHNSVKKHIKCKTDILEVRSCNFQHGTSGGSAFEIGARAKFSSCMFVPYNNDIESRWVDFVDTGDPARGLVFDSCRMSGEGGGISAVYNYSPGVSNGRNQTFVSFINTYVSCSLGGPGGNGGCVVLANSGTGKSVAPNYISFVNSVIVGNPSNIAVRTEGLNPVDSPSPIGFNIHADSSTVYGATAGLSTKTYSFVEHGLEQYYSKNTRSVFTDRVQVVSDTGTISIDILEGRIARLEQASSTTIEDIINGIPGEVVNIISGSSSVNIQDRSNGSLLYLKGAVDFAIGSADTITLIRDTANRWLETSRSVN